MSRLARCYALTQAYHRATRVRRSHARFGAVSIYLGEPWRATALKSAANRVARTLGVQRPRSR